MNPTLRAAALPRRNRRRPGFPFPPPPNWSRGRQKEEEEEEEEEEECVLLGGKPVGFDFLFESFPLFPCSQLDSPSLYLFSPLPPPFYIFFLLRGGFSPRITKKLAKRGSSEFVGVGAPPSSANTACTDLGKGHDCHG